MKDWRRWTILYEKLYKNVHMILTHHWKDEEIMKEIWILFRKVKYFFMSNKIYAYCNRLIASEAKWASASQRSKLYLTNGYPEKNCISETKHFGHMVLGTKSVCFDPISRYMEWTGPTRPDPTRPDPTVTLLRGL